MKTVAAFNRAFEAHMLIARLEASGIAAFARDEHMVTLDWLAANAIGGVKVDVADEDFDRAVAVMTSPAIEAVEPTEVVSNAELARVKAVQRRVVRNLILFLVGALAVGWGFSYAMSGWGSLLAGLLGGCLVLTLGRRKNA